MFDRRRFLKTGLGTIGLGGVALAFPRDVRDDLPNGNQAKGMITESADRAVERGLDYLAMQQNRNTGAWGTGQYSGNVAVTSLAALAFMAGGNVPGRGKYGQNVQNALRYVLSRESRFTAGYLDVGDTTHGPMYAHGFGTLFLGEVYGMVSDEQTRNDVQGALRRAVSLILQGQNRDGGWRYRPGSQDSDISVTICQIMALRSARNAGIDVPSAKVKLCVDYVKRCQDAREGWFKYRVADAGGDQQRRQSFARTAAGLAALYSASIYSGKEVEAALSFLMSTFKPTGIFPGQRPDMYYFYGHYYAAQAMWTAGGEYWQEWFPKIRDELIAGQRILGNGAWPDICPHYGTAMACIILQVPNNYLPIIQK